MADGTISSTTSPSRPATNFSAMLTRGTPDLSSLGSRPAVPGGSMPAIGDTDDREDLWIPPLLKDRDVTDEQVRSALAEYHSEQRRRGRVTFSQILTGHGIITQAELARLMSKHYELPLYERLGKENPLQTTVKLIPASVSRRCKAIVISKEGDVATVVIAEPTQRNLREVCSSLSAAGVFGRKNAGLRAVHNFSVAAGPDILSKIDEALLPRITATEIQSGRKYIESNLKAAINEEASDIHFIPKEKSLEVKFRCDGILWTVGLVSGDRKAEVIANAKMFGNIDIAKALEPLDGQAAFELGSRNFKLRFSSMPTQYGEQVVIRILDQNTAVLPFASLGMSENDALAVKEAMDSAYGMLYCVGPTGSGKSTSLAAMVSQLDGNKYSIRTLENPIEYKLPNAVQSEVSENMTFAKGLRALLRQDPDYMLVGETRDLETAQIGIEAGLTGHMCFSTLHGNNAIGGIIRLLDMGAEQGPMLAACRLFVAQRLVRKLCPKCKRPSEDSAELLNRFKIPHLAGEHLWEPVGCPDCRDGFKSRIGIYEVRRMKDFEQAVIKAGKGCEPLCRQIVEERGMSTLQSDGFSKAVKGLTTLDEVFSQVVS